MTTKKQNKEDGVLLKMKRLYSKDETVAYMFEENAALHIEINNLKLQISSLHNTKKQDSSDKLTKTAKEWAESEYVAELKSQCSSYQKNCAKYKRDMREWRDKYMSLLADPAIYKIFKSKPENKLKYLVTEEIGLLPPLDTSTFALHDTHVPPGTKSWGETPIEQDSLQKAIATAQQSNIVVLNSSRDKARQEAVDRIMKDDTQFLTYPSENQLSLSSNLKEAWKEFFSNCLFGWLKLFKKK